MRSKPHTPAGQALTGLILAIFRLNGRLLLAQLLTPQTVANLNVPLTVRVIELQNSLERWRWLPN